MKYININRTELKSFSDKRKQRAKALLDKSKPQILDEFTYLVPSQSSNKKYTVTHVDSFSCDCLDFQNRCKNRGLYCKHIHSILLFERLKHHVEVEELKSVEKIETQHNEACPYCNSENLIKRGIRKTSVREKQRFSCKDCGKRFVLSPIPKIKGNAKLVCLAMDCFYKGLSYRDIADQFKQFYGLDLHHETIRRWVLRFSEVINKYAKTLTPKTSGVWNADETMILTKKGSEDKNRGEKDYVYVWNILDNETKFLLASLYSGHSRNSKDAQRVMKEAWEQNKKMPTQIITDKLPSYQDGIRKTFRNWGAERKVKHTSILGRRREVNNNAVENHHTHQKEFHKIRRGVNEVQTYQDGFKTFHNFIRKGAKDKLTPAERAGIEVNGNRWETMLLNSIKKVPNATGEQESVKSPVD